MRINGPSFIAFVIKKKIYRESLVLGVLYWRMKGDRRAVTYVNSQGETAPACSGG